jgi:hypothetical protein
LQSAISGHAIPVRKTEPLYECALSIITAVLPSEKKSHTGWNVFSQRKTPAFIASGRIPVQK